MRKLDIGGKCAAQLVDYLLELKEDAMWHYENAERQQAHDVAAQYWGRVRLINFMLYEAQGNLD